MENQVPTIVCPNCGATTSNLHNCEYCGSFLVQKASEGVDLADYKKIASQYSNPQVLSSINDFIEKIKKNPSYRESLFINNPITNETLVMVGNNRGDCIASEWDKDGIHIALTFFETGESASILAERFKRSRVFPLFTAYGLDGHQLLDMGPKETQYYELHPDEVQYYVDFGFDAEGACQLILQLVEKVYGVGYKSLNCKWTEADDKTIRNNNIWDWVGGIALGILVVIVTHFGTVKSLLFGDNSAYEEVYEYTNSTDNNPLGIIYPEGVSEKAKKAAEEVISLIEDGNMPGAKEAWMKALDTLEGQDCYDFSLILQENGYLDN